MAGLTHHVVTIDPDLESFRRGGSTRTAACTCGWRGPQRATLTMVIDDAEVHQGKHGHVLTVGEH
jgi:hypothetical protein